MQSQSLKILEERLDNKQFMVGVIALEPHLSAQRHRRFRV